jgi:hypothetical protein
MSAHYKMYIKKETVLEGSSEICMHIWLKMKFFKKKSEKWNFHGKLQKIFLGCQKKFLMTLKF